MDEERRCPQCGAVLPADGPKDFCPNCVIGVVAEDVPATAEAYARLVDGEVVVLRDGLRMVRTDGARLTIRTPAGYEKQYGDLVSPMNGRASIFGAVVFRTSSLALLADILATMDNPPPSTVGTESIVVRLPDYDSVLEFVGPDD